MRKALWGIAILIGVGAAVLAWTSRAGTPPFVDADGEIVGGSIAEERRVVLGGVEQYVLIRGRDRDAPLLVYVHGGPGGSETAFLRAFNAELENDFVAVYWDQRGAGKSFDAAIDPRSLTIERITADLGELVDLLREEFGREQLLLVAHSWGTVLGLEYVAKRPETVAAYIGISQIVDWLESDAQGYAWALAKAREAENDEAVAELEAIGPPPYSLDELFTQRKLVNALGGVFYKPQSNLGLLKMALGTPETAWPDFVSFVRGEAFSMKALWTEAKGYDARERHSELEVPILFMVGRHDRVVWPQSAADFLETVEAPDKEIVWFEHSAHMLPFEEPERFNALVRQLARRVGLLSK